MPTEPPVSVEQAAIHVRNSSATTEATAPATTCRRLGEGSAGSAGLGSGPFPSPEIDPEGKVRRVRSRHPKRERTRTFGPIPTTTVPYSQVTNQLTHTPN